MFARVFAFGIAIALKTMSLVFYRTLVRWITPRDRINWEELKIVIVLNHTSLFEPLFISAVPNKRIWRALGRLIVPIADVTLNRPLTGWIFRLLVPGAVSITRKRDETWDRFVSKARSGALTLIFPEGRMKRKNGLDKNGKPMTVKGGVLDILESLEGGKILFAYSGGLHHVQAPGEWLPRPFQDIRIAFEEVDLDQYKSTYGRSREDLLSDLQARLEACESKAN